MPIYAYQCQQCGEKFDAFRGIFSSDKNVVCPKCGTKKPQRLISQVFGNHHPNGGGFRFPT